MANRKFFVVDRDYRTGRFFQEQLRKEFPKSEADQVVVCQDEYDTELLGLTEDGKVLWRDPSGEVFHPPLSVACDALERVQKRAEAALKQAQKDLCVCRKIRRALEATREFGHWTEPLSPFSGLLRRMDD